MHVETTISEPLQKIIDDWDFLEATVAKKFSTFRAVGSNIYGVRRRAVGADGITDMKKGNISAIFELGPDGPVRHEMHANNFHNSMAYVWNPAKDSPEEAQARLTGYGSAFLEAKRGGEPLNGKS
jgi:hypothetical protein